MSAPIAQALNLTPPSAAVSAASAKSAAKATEARDEKNPATFSRLLARSRAATETAQQPPESSARPVAPATASSAKNPNSAARAEQRAHDDPDDQAGDVPDVTLPRAATEAARADPHHSAEDEAEAQPHDAAGSAADAVHTGPLPATAVDLISPLALAVQPAATALAAPVTSAATLDAAATPALPAASPLAVLGKAEAGPAGANASALAMPAGPSDPHAAIQAPVGSVALPNAALAQLAALTAGGSKGDEVPKPSTSLEGLLSGAAPAIGGQGVAAASRWIDNPTSATASVATAVDDPGFREALATQVSVFARGGLSKAELQLNPVELGPVSVNITMNGDQARVDFGADRAQTRKAIEAGWAELAASLHEAGFTLSGGGVSEQTSRQAFERPATPHNARTDRAGADDEAPVASIVAARPRAGSALDLYA